MHLYHQELAARGWAVLLVNPRGSDGYGEAFYDGVQRRVGRRRRQRLPRADRRARRRGPRRRRPARGHRLQLRRLHDLLADRPRRPVRGRRRRRRRQRPGQHVRRQRRRRAHEPLRARRHAVGSSPSGTPRCRRSRRSTEVTTPTLVLHGEDDLPCPVGQAQQWHTSLRERGVPTELVLYPDASHVFILLGPPSQRIDYNRRVVDWVEQYAVRGGRPRDRRRPLAAPARRCSPKQHHVPGAQLGILRSTRRRRRARRRRRTACSTTAPAQPVTDRLGLPDRLDHQGLDGHGRHAAGRRGPARPRRPGRRGAARAAARRPRRHQAASRCGTCSPTPAASTATSSPTPAAATTASRSTSTLLADAAQNHPLGATWSYCNSGFSVLGRVIEKLTGKTWDAGACASGCSRRSA